MAVDFLSAIFARWDADGSLQAAGLTPLYFGSAPGGRYPYSVLQNPAGKVERRTFGGGHVDHETYRLSIWSPDEDAAATLGEAARGVLDAIGPDPPAFDDGTLVEFLRTADVLHATKRQGTGGNPLIFVKVLTYSAKIWHPGTA
jgi:hypothetical protein